jgi:hypothetical protein
MAAATVSFVLTGCGSGMLTSQSAGSGAQSSSATGTTVIPSIPLKTFQDSLGINTHMSYTDGLYSHPEQVLADLRYIGIHNIREGVLVRGGDIPDRQGLDAQEYLANNGIQFNFLTSGNASFDSFTAPALIYFAGAHPGAIISIEGPNEINNWPILGPGTNEENASAFQSTLYQFVHKTESLSSIPVLYFTGGEQASASSLTGQADQLNAHPYAQAGQQPYTWLSSTYSSSFSGTDFDLKAMTETGYSTAEKSNYNGVDETTQASLILNNIFDAALVGSTHTYLYQLLEAYPNYVSNADTGYGIFHYTDGGPTLAAIALHNLSVSIPKDDASAPRSVSGIIAGLSPTTGKVLALTASDGSIYIALWDEQNIWDPNTQTSISPASASVSVSIPGSWKVSRYDPESDQSASVLSSGGNGNALYSLDVTTHVTFLVFHPSR